MSCWGCGWVGLFMGDSIVQKKLPVRKHPRLKGYNYSSRGAYFITFCVKNKHELLDKIVVGRGLPDAPQMVWRPGASGTPPPTCRGELCSPAGSHPPRSDLEARPYETGCRVRPPGRTAGGLAPRGVEDAAPYMITIPLCPLCLCEKNSFFRSQRDREHREVIGSR